MQLTAIQKFGYSSSEVFADFVEVCLAALLSFTDNLGRLPSGEFVERLRENRLSGQYEERYMALVKKYKENRTRATGERPADTFKRAWDTLQEETAQSQQDVLGALYESQISLGEHGQFFTPSPIAVLMSQMLGPYQPGERVSDPACGSGRLFIQLASQYEGLHFHGVDKSPICARMAAVNMWLFDLNADVFQGNSLTGEMSYHWRIRTGGYLWETKLPDGVASPTSSQEGQAASPNVLGGTEGKTSSKRSGKQSFPDEPAQQTLF